MSFLRVAIMHPDPELRERFGAALQQQGYETVDGPDLASLDAELVGCLGVLCAVDIQAPERRQSGEFLRERMVGGGCALAIVPAYSAEHIAAAQEENFDDFIAEDVSDDLLAARLELSLRARSQNQALEMRNLDAMALLELSQTLASSLEVSTILHEATLLVASVLQVPRCAIVLIDTARGKGMIVAASEDQEVRDLEIEIAKYPELQNLVDTSAPVIITDAANHSVVADVQHLLKEKNVGAELLFPIIYDEQVVGAVFLRSPTPIAHFDRRKTYFGMTVATALGVAIRNARLFDSFRDHTQRVNQMRLHAERRMRALQQYEDFFEYAADGMAVLDAESRLLYLNREGHRILGHDRNIERETTFDQLLDPDSKLVLQHMLDVIRQGQYCRNIDLTAEHGSGEERSLSVSASPLGEGHGLAVLSFRDVTELREMQTELKTTKDFLENLIDSSVDGIVAADLRGNVLLFNKGAERIYGYNAPEVIGRLPVWRLYPRGIAVEIMRELRGDERGGVGRVVQKRTQIRNKDNQDVPVSLTSSIIYEDGVEVATVGIFSDLRERIQMERELDEAHQLVIQSERHAAVVELAGAAAHELNQPLTSVVGYSEMLQRKIKEADPLRRPVDKIYKEAERMADIVRKLGRITKYETKPYGDQARILDLDRASGPPRIPPASGPNERPAPPRIPAARPGAVFVRQGGDRRQLQGRRGNDPLAAAKPDPDESKPEDERP